MKTVQLTSDLDGMLMPPPAPAMAIRSMLSPNERHLLFNLACSYHESRGLIIDGGAFFGGSTSVMGHGLRGNQRLCETLARWPRPIRSYEMAIFLPRWEYLNAQYGIDPPLQAGDSFEPHLRRNIAPVADLVDLRIGDILESAPPSEPIEILFHDILKTPAIGDFAVRHFFTKLIPGVSLVIEQDYFSAEAPWLSRIYEHFADRFDYLGEIQSTAVFRSRHAITPAEAAAFVDEGPDGEASIALAEAAMARSVDPNRRFMLAIAKLQVINKARGADAARAYCATLPQAFPEQTGATRWRRLSTLWNEFRTLAEAGRIPLY